MAAILFFVWQTVKILKKLNIIIFVKFMEREVKKVVSPQDLKSWPKNYLVLRTSTKNLVAFKRWEGVKDKIF